MIHTAFHCHYWPSWEKEKPSRETCRLLLSTSRNATDHEQNTVTITPGLSLIKTKCLARPSTTTPGTNGHRSGRPRPERQQPERPPQPDQERNGQQPQHAANLKQAVLLTFPSLFLFRFRWPCWPHFPGMIHTAFHCHYRPSWKRKSPAGKLTALLLSTSRNATDHEQNTITITPGLSLIKTKCLARPSTTTPGTNGHRSGRPRPERQPERPPPAGSGTERPAAPTRCQFKTGRAVNVSRPFCIHSLFL